MLVQDFTADEIEAYAVTVQVVPPLPPTVVVVAFAVVLVVDFYELESQQSVQSWQIACPRVQFSMRNEAHSC